MLVTDIGDKTSWLQVRDVGDDFDRFGQQRPYLIGPITSIQKLLPEYVANIIMMSPTSLLPRKRLNWHTNQAHLGSSRISSQEKYVKNMKSFS